MSLSIRPGLLVATTIAFGILCSLGVWQLHRLEWKRGLIAQITDRLSAQPISFDEALVREDAGENMEYQPVFLDGVYENEIESSVFGTYEGAPGVYLFTPLRPEDLSSVAANYVFINRGFVPQAFKEPQSRTDSLVDGPVRVEGLFRHAEKRRGFEKWLAPADQPDDNLYFVRDPLILAMRPSINVPAFYVDSNGRESAAPWPKGGLTRIDIPNRHLEYALTWFGLAAALIGVFIAYSLKRA